MEAVVKLPQKDNLTILQKHRKLLVELFNSFVVHFWKRPFSWFSSSSTTWIPSKTMLVSRKNNWQSRTLPFVLACCCILPCQDCAPCCRPFMRLSPVFPRPAQTTITSLWISWVAAGAPPLPWPLPVSHIWQTGGIRVARVFITSGSYFVFLWKLSQRWGTFVRACQRLVVCFTFLSP